MTSIHDQAEVEITMVMGAAVREYARGIRGAQVVKSVEVALASRPLAIRVTLTDGTIIEYSRILY